MSDMKELVGQLEPCPFCGSAAKYDFEKEIGAHFVLCGNEYCNVRPMTNDDEKDAAFKQWNRRSLPAREQQKELIERLLEPRQGIHEDGTEELKTWEQLWEQCREAAAALRAPTSSSAQAGGWVAVSESTPDGQYHVLITDGKFIGMGDCCKGHLWNTEFINGPVTHWQPLPPPPVQHTEGDKP